MNTEIETAIKWWCQALRDEQAQDNGDHYQSALFTAMRRPVTDEQIKAFALALRILLPDYLSRGWERAVTEHNSHIGQALRVIATDYEPQGPLADAAEVAGISSLAFPLKTVMWINPGEVKVSRGYRADINLLELEAQL